MFLVEQNVQFMWAPLALRIASTPDEYANDNWRSYDHHHLQMLNAADSFAERSYYEGSDANA